MPVRPVDPVNSLVLPECIKHQYNLENKMIFNVFIHRVSVRMMNNVIAGVY